MRLYTRFLSLIEILDSRIANRAFKSRIPVLTCGAGGGKGSMGKAGLSLLTSLMGGSDAPEPPQMQAPPPVPAPAPAPPPPTASTAKEVGGEETVVDAEAAAVRANKRRSNAETDNLMNLSTPADSSVTLSKSILGE